MKTEEKRGKLKLLEIAALLFLAAFLASGAMALQTGQELSDKVVRLHVLANSDSEEDQALKLLVRDQVLERAASLLEQAGDRRQAEMLLRQALPELEEAAASTVYTMAALPENTSLEQRNLGFDHCTPVHGALSSAFGWREHPVEGGSRFHYGVDLAAEEGTDILAFADGTVYATGESSTLGNYIMLQHRNGYITLYAHCSRVTATGGSVSKGDKIAEVGATGLVTGPHLHFELHDGDLYLNPIFYVEIG